MIGGRGARRRGAGLAALVVGAACLTATPARSGVPAAGGRPVLSAALEAPLTVVGRVRSPEPLDDVAWIAGLDLERVLHGDAAPGTRIEIAWEELARGRPRRFDDGSRVLLVLEPLPGWSVWRARLGSRTALGVARRGDAFLREPDDPSLESLGALLALPPGQRDGSPGLEALCTLARRGAEPLALSALETLATRPGLAVALPEPAGAELAALIEDPARPVDVRARAARFVGEHGLARLRPTLARVDGPGSPIADAALESEARLDGGFSAERVEELLARPEPAVRAVALRHAPDDLVPDPARARLAGDPSPQVRAEAARALGRRRGLAAFDDLAAAVRDPDADVRGAAATALGELGEPAVPRLAELAMASDVENGREWLFALARAGTPGRRALAGVATSHPDETLRRLASFLLGQPPKAH